MTQHARHSIASQAIHAGRSSNPCPVDSDHDGDCMTAHPAGITLMPSGGWKATPVRLAEDWEINAWREPEHYA